MPITGVLTCVYSALQLGRDLRYHIIEGDQARCLATRSPSDTRVTFTVFLILRFPVALVLVLSSRDARDLQMPIVVVAQQPAGHQCILRNPLS
jgi:hypothetical protein